MDFSNIKIDTSEVLRYLGANGAKDGEFCAKNDGELCAKIEEGKQAVMSAAAPKITYKENDREIVFAATLGASVDKLINKTQLSDMGLAVIYDAVANAAIEGICDEFEKEVSGGKLGARFSPGYGDFPLSAQASILQYLDATAKIGLTLTSGGMLNPVKSVTAIIRKSEGESRRQAGEGESQRRSGDGESQGQIGEGASQRRGCDNCNMKDSCEFRKEGR